MESSNYKCCECGKHFSLAHNLRKHAKKFHLDKIDSIAPKKTYKYQCQLCRKNFNILRHFHYHKNVCPKSSQNNILRKKHHCPLCKYEASKSNLLTHFKDHHNLKLEKEHLEFHSFEDFMAWKSQIEKNTCSQFVRQRTVVSHKKGDCIEFFCHRSGTYVSKGKGLRTLKTQGSNKINGYCPAFIRVYIQQNKTCEIFFGNTHVGHENDVEHLSLTVKERETIASKLALKIPFQEVLDKVRDSIEGPQLERIHRLTKQDLYNIRRSSNLQSTAVRHQNDAVSVDAWVKEVESSGCVLYYKPRGMESVRHPELSKGDFVLIIMNPEQEEVFKKYCSNCVCLDGIQGLNQYNCELHTILIVDDIREAIPCAFLISNRSDEEIIRTFFYYVKRKIGYPVATKVFMSDMVETYYKAWQVIMGPSKFRLFSTWHVDRSWRKNLLKIPNQEKQVSTYKSLCTMSKEKNEEAFLAIVNNFVSTIISDPETRDFGEYFSDQYLNNLQSWAYCYKMKMSLNPNMHNIERMHHTIKYIYSNSQNVTQLDKAIHEIYKFVRDKLTNICNTLNNEKRYSKIEYIHKRHETSKGLSIGDIVATKSGWEVASSSPGCCEVYYIDENKSSCNCNLICTECNVCIHKYSCSCVDSCIMWNMCKHAHLLCTYLNQTPRVSQGSDTLDDSNLDIHSDSDSNESNSLTYKTITAIRPSDDAGELVRQKLKLKTELIPHLTNIIDDMVCLEQIEAFEKLCATIEPKINAMRQRRL